MTDSSDVKEKLEAGFGSLMASIPIGVMFMLFGMEVDLRALGKKGFLILLLLVVIGTKAIGYWVGTRKAFDSHGERVFTTIAALPQGEMGMLIAAYSFSRGLLSPSNFKSVIALAALFTMVIPVLIGTIPRMQQTPT
jgi:Kef-type K+ transport system membrane component KefB